LPDRTGMRHPHFCPYGPFPAKGGGLFGFAVLSDEHWRALCLEVLDRGDLHSDARFGSNEGRVQHRDELEPELELEFAARPADEWLERFRAVRLPCGAVNDVRDVLEHPQLAHNRLVAEVGSPVGTIPVVGSPFLVDGRRPESGSVPALGEDTADILGDLGVEPG
jgi:itaconate CoA-transferase